MDNPVSVKVAVAIKNIENILEFIQGWAGSEQRSNSIALADRLAVEIRALQTEMDRLSDKLKLHLKILKDIQKEAYIDEEPTGKSLDGETRMQLLLSWSYIIEGILADLTLLTPPISDISITLNTHFPILLNVLPSTPNTRQPRPTPQKRLNALYESTLKSSTTLTFLATKLKNNLFAISTTAIPHTSTEATKDFAHTLFHDCHHTPKPSFLTAQQSVQKLIRLSTNLLSSNLKENVSHMRAYTSKLSIHLRVLETYFYRRPDRIRRDLFGHPESTKLRKGFPVSAVNMFQVEEISGILAGLVGVCITLKVCASRAGLADGVFGMVEVRMKTLKRCLIIMWERELAFLSKVEWMESPQRIVKKVKRKEEKENVPDDWEKRAAKMAFGAETPIATSKKEKEEPVVGEVEVEKEPGTKGKKKKRKKGGKKHRGVRDNS